MKIEQRQWTQGQSWELVRPALFIDTPQLVLVMGSCQPLQNQALFDKIKSWYPKAHVVSVSTAGEIKGAQVQEDSLVVTAVEFEKTSIQVAKATVTQASDSESIGRGLVDSLPRSGLKHVMVFSEGLHVNGSGLVKGVVRALPQDTSITGGLAGDGVRFQETLVGLNEPAKSHQIVAIGFYGEALQVGCGSVGGWETFGGSRLITRSEGNVLYALGGEPALAVYKDYLGDLAHNLPASGLLFPLNLHLKNAQGLNIELTRTILAVDEKTQAMTFAGDMPEGVVAQFMRADMDHLVDAAGQAADLAMGSGSSSLEQPALAVLVSCVGRRLVLDSRVEEELRAVQAKLGTPCVMTGFYSYGEICPFAPAEHECQLHNQTMTITTFSERV